jgi:hypothetical protein
MDSSGWRFEVRSDKMGFVKMKVPRLDTVAEIEGIIEDEGKIIRLLQGLGGRIQRRVLADSQAAQLHT